MRKIIVALCVLSGFGMSFLFARATGTFQLVNFNSSGKAVVNQPYSIYINFFYSGTGVPSLSITGSPVPIGMKLGTITHGANGYNSIQFSGTPIYAQDYPLTVVLTDNNGALLAQLFDFNVVDTPIVITTNSLPDGTVGQPYSATVKFTFVSKGNTAPLGVGFDALPPGIQGNWPPIINWTSAYGGDGAFVLSGEPKADGQFKINFSVPEGGITSNDFNNLITHLTTFGEKEFIININPQATPNIPTSSSVSQPTTTEIIKKISTTIDISDKIAPSFVNNPTSTKVVAPASQVSSGEASVPSSTTVSQNNQNPIPAATQPQPKTSWLKRFFQWLANLF